MANSCRRLEKSVRAGKNFRGVGGWSGKPRRRLVLQHFQRLEVNFHFLLVFFLPQIGSEIAGRFEDYKKKRGFILPWGIHFLPLVILPHMSMFLNIFTEKRWSTLPHLYKCMYSITAPIPAMVGCSRFGPVL